MSYLIDSHCHLHDQEWFTPEQAEDLIASARTNHVEKIITIGTDPKDSSNARIFASGHEGIYWTYGIHPEFADKITPSALDDAITGLKNSSPFRSIRSSAISESPAEGCVSELDAKNPITPASMPVAIGEIGLDYHYENYDRDRQICLFERLLQLADDLSLPVSLHIRGAFDDALPILDNFPRLTGVVHSFTGSKKVLRQVLSRDFYVGVNGLATYSTLPLPPLEKMVLETDAPFLTPIPFRGTMNKPEYVRLVANYLSEEMGVAKSVIAEQTTKNVRGLFHI